MNRFSFRIGAAWAEDVPLSSLRSFDDDTNISIHDSPVFVLLDDTAADLRWIWFGGMVPAFLFAE